MDPSTVRSMKPVPLSPEAQAGLAAFSLWDILYGRALIKPWSSDGPSAKPLCGLERILREMENLVRLTRALVMDLVVPSMDQDTKLPPSAHLKLPESLARAWGFPTTRLPRYQFRSPATVSSSLPWFPDLNQLLPHRVVHPPDSEVDVTREFALPGTTITKVTSRWPHTHANLSPQPLGDQVDEWIDRANPSSLDLSGQHQENDIVFNGTSDPIERTVELILSRAEPDLSPVQPTSTVKTALEEMDEMDSPVQANSSPDSPSPSIDLPDVRIRSTSSDKSLGLTPESAPVSRNTQRHRDWFACPKCKTFVGNLKLHLKVCNGIKSRRLRYHFEGSKYYCREADCTDLENTAYNTFWQFESHCKSEHLTLEDYQHECPTCHKKFYNRMKLVKHRSNNHRILHASSSNAKLSTQGKLIPDSLHTCQICGMKFRQAPSMKRHINRKHPEIADKPKYCCDFCGKGYLVEAHLQRHLERLHYNPVEFKKESQTCHRCGYTNPYSESQKFYRHVKFNCPMLDGNQCQCPICGARLRYSTGLRTHIREVHRLDANEVLGTPRRANSSAVPKPKSK